MEQRQFDEIIARLERVEAAVGLGEYEPDEEGPGGEGCCCDEPGNGPRWDAPGGGGGPGLGERRMIDLIVHLVSERVEELLERRCECHHDRPRGEAWEHRGRRHHHDRRPDEHESRPRHRASRIDEGSLVDLVARLVSERVERAIGERLEQLRVGGSDVEPPAEPED
jgi:hypothetical protein